MVVDSKIDAYQFLYPLCLLSIEYLCRGEVLQVLVVLENLNLMNGSFAVTTPVFEGIHNREKLLIVDFVFDLHGLEFPGVESHRVQFPLFVSFGQHRANRKVRGIGLNDDWSLAAKVRQNW